MTRTAHLLICLLLVALISGTASGQDRNGIARLQELTFPEYKVKEVTLDEGLDIVRQAWTRKYPDQSFPVIIVGTLAERSVMGFRATMDLKNVPALAVVTYLAQTHLMTVHHGLDMVVLRPFTRKDEHEPWTTEMIDVPQKAIAALDLPQTDGDGEVNARLKKQLESFGIMFEPDFALKWYGNQLLIRNTHEEIAKLKGLLMLMEAGYTISKKSE